MSHSSRQAVEVMIYCDPLGLLNWNEQ